MKEGFPRGRSGKELACQSRRRGFNPWVRKIPWRRKWQPTPVFLPGKSQGQKSLGGLQPMGLQSLTRLSLHRPLAPSPIMNPAFAILNVNISLYFTSESKENSR